MQQQQPYILVVGGADTGRAPMTVALLQRLLSESRLEWRVESAGVTGHDDAPAESEARNAMVMLGLDIQEHRARSISDVLVEKAQVLLAVDSGTARVLRLRYPADTFRIITLGELAGRQRDIPDPFRMQIGVWIRYAQEIEALLRTGLDRLQSLVEGAMLPSEASAIHAPLEEDGQSSPVARISTYGGSEDIHGDTYGDKEQQQPAIRPTVVERCLCLVTVMSEMPTLVNWSQTRLQLEHDIQVIGTISLSPDDLVQAYARLLLSMLRMCATLPEKERCRMLRTAIERLQGSIDQQALTDLSAILPEWTAG